MSILTKDGKAVPFHGDHHPVSIHEGRKSRNLWPFETDVQGGANRSGNFIVYLDDSLLERGKRYTLSGKYFLPSSDTSTNPRMTVSPRVGTTSIDGYRSEMYAYDALTEISVTFTIPERADNLQVYVLDYSVPKPDRTGTYITDLMLNEGSEALPFERPGTVTDTIYEPDVSEKSGTTVEFEDTYNDVAEVGVGGKSEQKSLSGKNLFDVHGERTVWSSSVVDEGDDWLYCSLDNTDGTGYIFANFWTNKSDLLKPMTTYTAVAEVKDLVGEIYAVPVSLSVGNTNTQFITNFTANKNGWQKGNVTTLANGLDAATGMCRGYFTVPAGGKGSMRIRVSLIPYDQSITEDKFTYEPYCGGIPSPNPDYPQPIESIDSVELVSRGRNLFDGQLRYGFWNYSTGIYAYTQMYTCNVNRIRVTPSTTYFVDCSTTDARFYFYKKDGTYIGTHSGGNSKRGFVTTPDNCFFMNLGTGDSNSGLNVKIIICNEQHDYEPYRSSTATIDLQGHELRSLPGGTKDELVVHRDGMVELVQRVQKFTASAWTTDIEGSRIYSNLPASLGIVNRFDRTLYPEMGEFGTCNKLGFARQALTYRTQVPCFAIVDMGGFPRVYVADGLGSTDVAASWLNGLYFLAPLATERVIQLPSIDPIKTFHSYTAIYDQHGNDITARVKVIA